MHGDKPQQPRCPSLAAPSQPRVGQKSRLSLEVPSQPRPGCRAPCTGSWARAPISPHIVPGVPALGGLVLRSGGTPGSAVTGFALCQTVLAGSQHATGTCPGSTYICRSKPCHGQGIQHQGTAEVGKDPAKPPRSHHPGCVLWCCAGSQMLCHTIPCTQGSGGKMTHRL